jgi:hypothetical protein
MAHMVMINIGFRRCVDISHLARRVKGLRSLKLSGGFVSPEVNGPADKSAGRVRSWKGLISERINRGKVGAKKFSNRQIKNNTSAYSPANIRSSSSLGVSSNSAI